MSTAVTFSALAASWPAVTATCAVSASRTARWRLWRSRVVTDGILPACDIRRSVGTLLPRSSCQGRADRVVLQAAGRGVPSPSGVVTSCWKVASL